nr:ribonuclease H-like domain-containing protein [Tanacetum cinerariifolium]
MAKNISGEVQLHARVDGKELVITESPVRRDLLLADEEAIDCLRNSTIFKQLALMGYKNLSQKLTFYKPFFSPQWKFLIHTSLQSLSLKTNAWNEFSSTMASAIICLATDQKFNVLILIFDIIIRNLDNLSDKDVHKELGDRLMRAATIASSLEAEKDSGNINKTQSKETPNESSSQGTNLGGGPVGEEVFVEEQNENVIEEVVDAAQVSTTAIATTITTKEITFAQALKALKTLNPKVKENAFKEPEITKKQKVEDDKEKEELKQLTETILDEEKVAVDAILLTVKSPRIVDQKIHKEGKKSYYQIVRADEKSQMYLFFCQMLKSFDREDLEDLYKLVKARYGSTRPVENMDYLLWSDMKIMFEPHVEDELRKRQQGYKVLEWKLYDSCRVHSLMMQSMQIYMLVEKKYPLTLPTLSMMMEKESSN